MKRISLSAIFGLSLLVAACSVTGEGEDVAVKHSVNQDIVGKWAAETYCGKSEMVPRLVKVSPTTSDLSSLYFRTKISTYKCVPGDDG